MERVGGLSDSSKMPWLGWSLSARTCQIGGKLAKIEGTPCFKCYAFRGHYGYPVVRQAHANRMRAWKRKGWVKDMADLIGQLAEKEKPANRYFRWFDSGDLQSVAMLQKIADVARQVPEVYFWLPTQERKIVTEFLAGSKLPTNLVIRLSSPRIGVKCKPIPGTVTSNISGPGFTCPAKGQGNKCGPCRMCWNKKVKTVSYVYH